MDATTLSSSTVAAAVDAGAGVGVAVKLNVGDTVIELVAFAVGLGVDPHETSSTIASIGVHRANRPSKLTPHSDSWT